MASEVAIPIFEGKSEFCDNYHLNLERKKKISDHAYDLKMIVSEFDARIRCSQISKLFFRGLIICIAISDSKEHFLIELTVSILFLVLENIYLGATYYGSKIKIERITKSMQEEVEYDQGYNEDFNAGKDRNSLQKGIVNFEKEIDCFYCQLNCMRNFSMLLTFLDFALCSVGEWYHCNSWKDEDLEGIIKLTWVIDLCGFASLIIEILKFCCCGTIENRGENLFNDIDALSPRNRY